MASEPSLKQRVAAGAALAAGLAALLSAVATSALAAQLLRREEDQRLAGAAAALAEEFSQLPDSGVEALERGLREELAESHQPGLVFELLAPDGNFLAGDGALGPASAEGCDSAGGYRRCRVTAPGGRQVLVGVRSPAYGSVFALATLIAVAALGLLGFVVSRPLAAWWLAPLARLGARVGRLTLDAGAVDLGPREPLAEVEALRRTIELLVGRANAAIDQAQRFAANAAHELRTPCTALRGELELLLENPGLQAPEVTVIQAARDKVGELTVLVDRLMILALPPGARPTAHEVVSLRDVVEDLVAELPAPAAARVEGPAQDATVSGDPVLLGVLVGNALGNALKFAGRVTVAVRTAGEQVELTFTDDGPGVAPEERERLFEPFFRGVRAGAERAPGHGLGLALIRHVAHTHGGDARFVEPGGPGARLVVTLRR